MPKLWHKNERRLDKIEAERLAKEAAEKQAEEDAKKAELEAEEGGDI
ncbi:hypothetical protein QZL56_03425 [Providencia stuartii]|nr:hypothetical protein [Providencia sp. 2.29]MDN7222420.1 hypothetical protein [Providencia stuartii]